MSSTPSAPPFRSAILLPIFFLSGLSALLYQIVWLKYLGFVFGNTVYAAATLIAVYLAGLGIGAALFARIRVRQPLLVYALVEAGIGAFAAFSPNAFSLIDRLYIASFQHWLDAPVQLALARIVAAAIFLLPPTILMGGTLPLLVRAFRRDDAPEGHAVASLYAANTFGATAGVACAGFLTIPTVGLLTTIFFGVIINFVLAALSALLAFSRSSKALDGSPAAREAQSAVPSGGGRFLLLATLLMGMTSIADEVFWSRILVLHLGSSVYAYSLMLFSFLIGLAIGSAVIDRVIATIDARRWLGRIEIVLAVVLALQIHYFTRFADVLEFFARLYHASSYTGTMFAFLSATLSAIVVPTALMGATFPLVVRLFAEESESGEERAVGVVYFWNTVGSISGSLLAGFVLVKAIGSQNGLLLMAAINLLLGVTFLRRYLEWKSWTVAAAIVVIGAAALAKPSQVILSAGLFTDDHAKILVFREDTTATVTLREYANKALSLELNGVNVAGTSRDLIGTQKLQGHLPLLMHPNAKSVLHIGFGSGGTAYAVSRHDVSKITIAEISPEVLETSDRYLGQVNHGVLHDRRTLPRIADGRNYVLAAPEKFDVILSDSIHPRYAGNGSLYTRDYFELCRKKLNPNGIVSMWLPIYSLTPRNYLMIVRAFRDVFPNTTVWYVPNYPNAFTIVIGRTEEGPLPLQRMQSQITPKISQELEEIGIHDMYDVASALLLDGEDATNITAIVPPHVDDLPAVEYESGRVIDRDGTWWLNFRMLTERMSPLSRAFSQADASRLMMAEKIRGERSVQHLKILEGWLARERGMVPIQSTTAPSSGTPRPAK